MQLNLSGISQLTTFLDDHGLLPPRASEQLSDMSSGHFVFHAQLAAAESIHMHIKVSSTDQLPHPELVKLGGIPQNSKAGYIKYAFPGDCNFIFSSIPASEEERLGIGAKSLPYLDHAGIDMRDEHAQTYALFEKIPLLSAEMGWPWKKQGGEGKQVACCHALVNEKYWVYPPGGVYLEFAFGKLVISAGDFGNDFRPSDPSLSLPEPANKSCCDGTSSKTVSPSGLENPPSHYAVRARRPGILRQLR